MTQATAAWGLVSRERRGYLQHQVSLGDEDEALGIMGYFSVD